MAKAPEWINAEFVQRALRHGDDNHNLSVQSISVRAALAVGENYSSDMLRVTVQLQESTVKRHIVIKIVPKCQEHLTEALNGFNTENNLFTKILPELQRILDEKIICSPIACKCLFSGVEPMGFLVLEDLSALGFKNAPRHVGLDLVHCTMVVQSLARFHASSVALKAKDPSSFDSYVHSVAFNGENNLASEFMHGSVKSFVEALEKWPEYHERFGIKLLNKCDKLFNTMVEKVRYRPGRFNVLTHGDVWTNNIMFLYHEGRVSEMRFVDFQMCTFTSPAVDLHYFLHNSPNEEVLLHHWDHLIAEYHSTLAQVLEALGCKHHGITLQELKEELEEYYFFALYSAMCVLPIALADVEASQDIKEAFDNFENVNEGGNYSAQNKKLYSNEEYMKRMRALLPIFEEHGLFDA